MKRDISEEQEKENLQYLFNVISNLKDIKVKIDSKGPLSQIDKKEITLNPDSDYNRKKSEGLQELGHVWLSGSLKEVLSNWNSVKYGNFDDFRVLVNLLEDIRTENLMSIRYPQIKNRLINLHIEKMSKFLEEFPDYVAKDPRVATYLLAENRFEIPIDIDPSIRDISSKIKELLENDNFRDGNWKSMVNIALHISEEIKKWEEAEFKPLSDKLQQMMQATQEVRKGYEELMTEESTQLDKQLKEHKNLAENSKRVADFQKKIDELKSLMKKSPTSLKELVNERINRIEKLKDREESLIDKKQQDLKDFEDYIKDIDKSAQEVYNQEYKPAVEKETRAAEEIGNKKRSLKENFNQLPKTYTHFFEELSEKRQTGSQLTKASIEAMVEKEKKEGQKSKAKIGVGEPLEEQDDEEMEELPPIDARYKPPRGTDVKRDFPRVRIVRTSDKFTSEGRYKIPDLRFALSTGYEIASTLKRALKLKSITLKDRSYGTLDIKAVKRQIAKYGKMIDPKVLKIRRNLIEKHSVMVLVDFSGSMSESIGEFSKVQYAKQALVTLGKTLEALNVNYSLRGFSARTGEFQICDIVMKDFEEPHMDYTLVNKVFYPNGPGDNCQNRDGSSIRHGSKLLLQQRGKKLLIVISDGLPHHPSDRDTYSGSTGNNDTIEAIREAEESGIHIMGISIDPSANNFVLKAYPNAFVFNDMKQFPLQLTNMYIKTIMG